MLLGHPLTFPIYIHHLQVVPSLDLSFQISPSPSRLHEFLVRMDVVNKTSSESFQVHQLSSVGHQWEISLLQPVDTIFPSQSLMAGQSLSCFFMLKVGRRAALLSSFSCKMMSVCVYMYICLGVEWQTILFYSSSYLLQRNF